MKRSTRQLDHLAAIAARNNDEDTLYLAKRWGAKDFSEAMREASACGHCKIIELCHTWNATNIDECLRIAVQCKQGLVVRIMSSLGASNTAECKQLAIETGQHALADYLDEVHFINTPRTNEVLNRFHDLSTRTL